MLIDRLDPALTNLLSHSYFILYSQATETAIKGINNLALLAMINLWNSKK